MVVRRVPKDLVDKLEKVGVSKPIAKLAAQLYAIGIDPPHLGRIIADLMSFPANPNDVGIFPEDYDKTERRIAEMLTENTGMHVLDSGMIYGYHWKNNRGRDFKREPAVLVTVYDRDDFSFSINNFHFLNAFLELNQRAELLQAMLELYSDLPENEYKSWLQIMIDFAKILDETGDFKYLFVENTYNIEYSILSQIIQYVIVYSRSWDEYYIMLQIHGGCDVRGGYTKPQFFKIDFYDDGIYWYDAMGYVSLECPKCGPLYYSSDLYWHTYYDGKVTDLSDINGDPEKNILYHSVCGSKIKVLPHSTILDYVNRR